MHTELPDFPGSGDTSGDTSVTAAGRVYTHSLMANTSFCTYSFPWAPTCPFPFDHHPQQLRSLLLQFCTSLPGPGTSWRAPVTLSISLVFQEPLKENYFNKPVQFCFVLFFFKLSGSYTRVLIRKQSYSRCHITSSPEVFHLSPFRDWCDVSQTLPTFP